MPIVGSWSWWHEDALSGVVHEWTHDVEFAPASIQCLTSLSQFGFDSSGEVYSGVVRYRTRDPTTGVDTTHTDYSTWPSALYAENCDSVTLWFRLEGGSGEVNDNVWGRANFNIFFWD
jgi:hypothetical protein